MFLEDLGAEMKCVKVVTATACVFFHRFYAFHSYKTQNRFNMAVACLFLASKTEEMLVKLKDIVIGYFRVRNQTHNPSESECKEMQKNVLLSERILLQTLGFDLTISHPHNPLLLKLRELKNYIPEDKRKEMYEAAIAFITDSYRTSLCLQYQPTQIFYGAILMAAIQLSLQPVSTSNKVTVEQSWFDLLERERDIDESAMKNICKEMMDLYDDEDNSLKCSIKDKATAMKNINQIVGQESLHAPPKPSPTGVAESEGGLSQEASLVNKVVGGVVTATSYDNLYQQEEERKQKNVTVTSFVKPTTPHHPRTNSLGLPPLEAPAPQPLDYNSDHSTFSEANREMSATPNHMSVPPETPVDSTPFSSYPCTPNFDSCPPPYAMREQDYRVKSQMFNSNVEDNSAPKRARIE